MKIKPIFAWYDFWIGFFWDRKKCLLYIFPIPMCGMVIDFWDEPQYIEIPELHRPLYSNSRFRQEYYMTWPDERKKEIEDVYCWCPLKLKFDCPNCKAKALRREKMPLKHIKVFVNDSDYAEESAINTDHIVSAVPKNYRGWGNYIEIKTVNGDIINAKCSVGHLLD